MSLIKFQVIAPDGRIGHQDIDWSTNQATEMLAKIESVLDTCQHDQQVFVIIDLYSAVKKEKKKSDEKKESTSGRLEPQKQAVLPETYETQPLWSEE